jgi:hypothetical protein
MPKDTLMQKDKLWPNTRQIKTSTFKFLYKGSKNQKRTFFGAYGRYFKILNAQNAKMNSVVQILMDVYTTLIKLSILEMMVAIHAVIRSQSFSR